MSQSLATRIRKNREVKVVVGKFTFICRRPTDVEAVAMYRADKPYSEVAQDYVIGWEGVTEDDLVGGGVQTLVPFDAEAWREWCADNPQFWMPIADRISEAYQLHRARGDEARKN